MRKRRLREPSHRRYGVTYRPSGRPGLTVMDWVNDGGQDEPLSTGDSHVLVLLLFGFLVAVGLIGAVAYALV